MVDGPRSGWDFPRGSSMTVLWVSICKKKKKRCGFPIHFCMSSKIHRTWPYGVEKNPRQVQPLSSHRARQGGSCLRSTSLFLRGIAGQIHELFDLYIGKIDDRVLLGVDRLLNATIGGLSISVSPLHGELLPNVTRSAPGRRDSTTMGLMY